MSVTPQTNTTIEGIAERLRTLDSFALCGHVSPDGDCIPKGRTMEQYKQEFIEFMVESDVLKFGEFTLKSGRTSPFFMNAGAYVTGDQLHRLGIYYARAIHDAFGLDFDVVFGPAIASSWAKT